MTTEDTTQFPKLDIFISHSSRDARIAEALVNLLRAALNIRADKIRCTSVDGCRLPGGSLTQEQLRQEIHDVRLLIGLLTKKSSQSAYVLFELGARWGASGILIPLLATGADVSILPSPLSAYTALRCENRAQIQQLVTNIAAILNIESSDPPAYEKQIEELIQVTKGKHHEEPFITLNLGLTRRGLALTFIVIYMLLILHWFLSYITPLIRAALLNRQ
jgi:hypothetical protein